MDRPFASLSLYDNVRSCAYCATVPYVLAADAALQKVLGRYSDKYLNAADAGIAQTQGIVYTPSSLAAGGAGAAILLVFCCCDDR